MTPETFNSLFNDLLSQANPTLTEEAAMVSPKYFGVKINVTDHTESVPESDRKEFMICTAAATTFLWLELSRKGVVVPIETFKMSTKEITRYVLPGVEGIQFPKDLLGEAEIHEEILKANKEIIKMGRKFFTVIEDVILHVDPKLFTVSDGLIKHAKRIKAPAYNVAPDYEPGLPAAFTDKARFVDVTERCKDKWFEARMDGVAFIRMDEFVRHFHIPSSMRNAVQHFTLRCADMHDGNITIGDELAKIGANVMPDKLFREEWHKLTGSEWKEGDPWILIPSVTMKSFRGDGIREKAFIIHRSSFETGVQLIRASKTGHMTSGYWASDADNITDGITDKVKHIVNVINDPILFKSYLMKHNVTELVAELTDDETSPREYAILEAAFRDASQLIAAGGEITDCMSDVVKIVNAMLRGAFRDAKYLGVNIKFSGHIDELPDGIEAIVPRKYKFVVREHNHRRGTYLDRFIRYGRDKETKELIGILDLEALTKSRGYLVIMRPPIVNGYPTLSKDRILFVDDINVIQMKSVHCKHMTMDMDGDFGLVTRDHPTKKVEDYMKLYYETMGHDSDAMMRRIENVVDEIMHDPDLTDVILENIPVYDDKPDSLANGKKEANKLASKYGNLDMLVYIIDHIGAKDVGAYTNGVLDILMHYRTSVPAHLLDDYRLFGNMALSIFSEGSIQRIKHPDIILPLTPRALRLFSGIILQKLGFIDKEISKFTLLDDAPVYSKRADRITRYGARPTELMADDNTWAPNIDEQISNIFSSIKHRNNMKKQGLIPATRDMNPREHLIWTQIQFNSLTDNGPFGARRDTIDPLYLPGAKSMDVDLKWMLNRNPGFDKAVKSVMWHIIEKFHATNRLLGDHPSIFFGKGIRSNGSLRFDAKHPIGRLFVALTHAEKHEKDIVPLIREHGEKYVIVALASMMYLRKELGFNYRIMNSGFTAHELEIYMQLVKAEMGTVELRECEMDIDDALTVKGYKFLYVPQEFIVVSEKKRQIYIDKTFRGNWLSKMASASGDAKEFRHNLYLDRKNEIMMGSSHIGIITETKGVLEALLDLREDVVIIVPDALRSESLYELEELQTKGAVNVRIIYV